ncbi:hypothetical protein P7C70_g3671, partial [Phenoliferia sp. Uapishka_3]
MTAITLANLDTLGFREPPPLAPDLPPHETYRLASDEVAALKALEVNFRLDAIVGLAVETLFSSEVDVNFSSIDNAITIWEAIEDQSQQLVANIKAVCIVRHHKTKYQVMPIVLAGHASKGQDAEMERQIWGTFELAVANRMRRLGWIYVGTASDGDRPRQLFEVKRCSTVVVSTGHPLHEKYSQMKGITPRVGEIGGLPTDNEADMRHLWKTGQTSLARHNGTTVGVVTLRPESTLYHCYLQYPQVDRRKILATLFPPNTMTVSPSVATLQYIVGLLPPTDLPRGLPPL